MAIVKLKLREGSKKGFQVTLKETNRDDEIEGHLLPLPQEIDPTQETSAFCRWQLGYREEEDVRSSYTRITPIGIKHSSPEEYAKYAEDVKTYLNQWLNSGDNEWLRIRDALVAICSRLNSASDEVGILLDVKDINLCRLPLQEWNFIENHCPQAEIAFRLPKSKDGKPSIHPLSSSKIRILVVVGWNNDINTDQDLKEIQGLEELGAEVKYLEQPKHDVLCDALWDQQGYHIFVYIGHSISKEDGQIGWIKVNEQEDLSIEDVKNALKEAINKGLQLAIFNSCDGLGLANQLAHLHLPQSIVMREPVPDQVAVKFLKYFFKEFTHGKSLFAAVHRSRKRLEDVFKSRYPGVHWLPVICVSHSVKKPLTWQDLIKSCSPNDVLKKSPKKPQTTSKLKQNWIAVSLLLLFLSGGVVIWWVTNQKQAQMVVRTSQINFIDVSGIPQGKWLFNGSTSWEEIIKKVHPKIQQELRQITLSLRPHPTSQRGSQIGINMLKNGEI
ncbi:CHAT domain-containing protein [Brasilonema octagenarum]|uniref:CHAT domain-containing protein n=1 Tax=Brasilonema octagenarum TaxID=417105 RepID=UPI002006DE2F|nr:CHAT domain-containing protein [Brasilonema octagenarum]